MGASDKARESFFQAGIDSMKMEQNTLQQLMTLSVGGLVLFFSFIGSADFLKPTLHWIGSGLPWLGITVVWCWIISLCSAVIGHFSINKMVVMIGNLTNAFNKYAIDERNAFNKLDENEEALAKLNNAIKDIQDAKEGVSENPVIILQEKIKNLEEALVEIEALKDEAMGKLNNAHTRWNKAFYPVQKSTNLSIRLSLTALIIGFFTLGTAYTIWTIAS